MSDVFERFLSTPEALEVFGERSFVQGMLDFEAALAHASAECGLIPVSAAPAIAGVCKAELFDTEAIVADSGRAGSLAIPLVKKLTETVALFDQDAARYVHWGATSQDVIDTAMALVTQRALKLLQADLASVCDSLAQLARTHRNTPVLARTLMQAAQVTSFGLKCAQWRAPIARSQRQLETVAADALSLQLGGAVGTRATLGANADDIASRMASTLGLANPVLATHTNRDQWLRLAAEVGVLCGSLGKLALDISLMSQSEIGELAEASGGGRGGSSAMPHKRNPVGSMVALAAANRAPQRIAAMLAAMPQQHERGLGNWQAELAEWAGLWVSALGSARAIAGALDGLSVYGDRMQANIDAMRGLVFAEGASLLIASVVGKSAAHTLVESASKRVYDESKTLLDVLQRVIAGDARLRGQIAEAALTDVFSSARVAGDAGRYVDRLLA